MPPILGATTTLSKFSLNLSMALEAQNRVPNRALAETSKRKAGDINKTASRAKTVETAKNDQTRNGKRPNRTGQPS